MKKQGSAELFEALKLDEVYTNGFDRKALRLAIWRADDKIGNSPLKPVYPSEDSFIDWAMKHEKIKRVSPGNYEFVDHLREPVDLAEDHFNYREGMEGEELAQDIRDAADMRPEDFYVIVDDVKRLPRKEKKRMKRELLRDTSARKITFGYLNWAS